MAFTGTVAIWAMKDNDYQATNFAGTAAGLQAALDYIGSTAGGEVYMGPGTITGVTNLTMYANTTLRGAGMNATLLKRAASATGITIREKTSGEGNGSSGATGIWIRDFKIDANGSAGDGVDLGNQGGAQLNINAGIDSVFVAGFGSGTGFNINANATYGRHIWSNSNNYGITFSGGGSNKWYGLWAEGNASCNLTVSDADNSFFGVHIEETVVGDPSNPSINLNSGNNTFYGVTISVQQPRTHLISLASGMARNTFYQIRVGISGLGSFTNVFYSVALATGTGNSNTVIPFIIDGGPHTFPGYFFNSSNNEWLQISGAGGVQLQAKGSSVASAGTITLPVGLTGGNFFDITGTTNITTINTTARQGGRMVTLRFTDAAPGDIIHGSNIQLAGGVNFSPAQNDAITLVSDGTNWVEA